MRKTYFIQVNRGKRIDDFSLEIMQARRQWNIIFNALKENCQLRILYPVKIALKNKVERKPFSDQQTYRVYSSLSVGWYYNKYF